MNTEKNKIISTLLYWLPSIIFNIVETVIIFGIAILMDISIYNIIYILSVFQVVRHLIKKDKHYKNPFKCLIWTTLIFTSIFLMAKVNMIICTAACIFAPYILSGNADINKKEDKEVCKNVGMYMWKPKDEPSKYKFIEDYIEENKDTTELMEFENFLEEIDSQNYKIYSLRFYEGKSLKYITEEMEISSTARVTEKLDEIQNILKVYLKVSHKVLETKN